MSTERTEEERLCFVRDYWERGCICLVVDKTLPMCGPEVPDHEAIARYEAGCKCSRNYAHLEQQE